MSACYSVGASPERSETDAPVAATHPTTEIGVAVWILVAALACRWSAEPGPPALPVPAPAAPSPEVVEPAPLPPAPEGARYAASHVLVAWAGAAGADATVTRTEAEAEALAARVHARALAGEDLAALARAHSDGPSAPRGGRLGVWETGTMVPDFEAAVASVEVGAIAPLIRTPFGWHVARRDVVEIARGAQLVVAWDGAWRSTATRSRDEARERIAEAAAALAVGEPFAAVAVRFGDDASAPHGGGFGEVTRGQLVPAVDDALFSLAPGQTSDVVESALGFHLVHRQE